ncbi:MAG: hypothetical protein HQL99_14105 [Magnetococcales bacterium]|nr:hypothetical protein [Magnetococcales bacterium]
MAQTIFRIGFWRDCPLFLRYQGFAGLQWCGAQAWRIPHAFPALIKPMDREGLSIAEGARSMDGKKAESILTVLPLTFYPEGGIIFSPPADSGG